MPKRTPCKTCINREQDNPDLVYYCGLSGKEIAGESTDEFEDAKAYCVNHTRIGPNGPQMLG